MSLFTTAFWKSIAWALVRTFVAGVTPFVPALVNDFESSKNLAIGTVALLLIAQILTSLKGLPDMTGAPWWQVLVSRTLRQFGQFMAAGTVGAVLLWDVDWHTLLTSGAQSALTTLVLAGLTLLPSGAEPPASTARHLETSPAS